MDAKSSALLTTGLLPNLQVAAAVDAAEKATLTGRALAVWKLRSLREVAAAAEAADMDTATATVVDMATEVLAVDAAGMVTADTSMGRKWQAHQLHLRRLKLPPPTQLGPLKLSPPDLLKLRSPSPLNPPHLQEDAAAAAHRLREYAPKRPMTNS